jgi:hypothetical protein
VKDFSAISPDAEIRPYRRAIDLQAGFCHPPLRHIFLAMVDKPTQACMDSPGAGFSPVPLLGAHAQRLEREVLLSLC